MYTKLRIFGYYDNRFHIELKKDDVQYYYNTTNGTFGISGNKLLHPIYNKITLTEIDASTLLSLMDNTTHFEIMQNINDFPTELYHTILTKLITNTCITFFGYPYTSPETIPLKDLHLITEIFKHNETLTQIYCYPAVECFVSKELYKQSQICANIRF